MGIGLFSIINLVWHLLPQYGLREAVQKATSAPVFFRYPQLDYPKLEWALVTIDLFMAMILVWTLIKSSRIRFAIIGIVLVLWTPWMSTVWHAGYDEYYQTLNRTQLPIRLRELSGARRFCIGNYAYYQTLGSDRSGNAFRPLFLPTPDSLKDYLIKNQIDFVAAPQNDSHWSKRYELMLEYMYGFESNFTQVDDVDGYVIFERKNQTGVVK